MCVFWGLLSVCYIIVSFEGLLREQLYNKTPVGEVEHTTIWDYVRKSILITYFKDCIYLRESGGGV